jgi:hypothetical protein
MTKHACGPVVGLNVLGLVIALGCSSAETLVVNEGGVPGAGGNAGAESRGGSGGGSAGTRSLGGAGGEPGSGNGGNGNGGAQDCTPSAAAATIEEHPATAFTHQAQCSAVTYDTNPPSGGNHYATWAAFQTYSFPLSPGFLVHSLEHGAIVLWYNCADGCDAEVAAAQAFIDALPEDALCDGQGAARRLVLVPYPALERRWAASAWGWTLNADCFDPTAFGDFVSAHYGRGREDLCNGPGVVFSSDPCN